LVQFLDANANVMGEYEIQECLLLAIEISADGNPSGKRMAVDRNLHRIGTVSSHAGSGIRERQREGIDLAKKAGVYKGRKPSLSAMEALAMRRRAANGANKAALAREFGISRATLYVYLASG